MVRLSADSQGQEMQGLCSTEHRRVSSIVLARWVLRKSQPGLHNSLVTTKELSQNSTQKFPVDYAFAKHFV